MSIASLLTNHKHDEGCYATERHDDGFPRCGYSLNVYEAAEAEKRAEGRVGIDTVWATMCHASELRRLIKEEWREHPGNPGTVSRLRDELPKFRDASTRYRLAVTQWEYSADEFTRQVSALVGVCHRCGQDAASGECDECRDYLGDVEVPW